MSRGLHLVVPPETPPGACSDESLVLACCCFVVAIGATAARGQSTITSPVVVPLHFTQLPGNQNDPPVYKLGIYVGIGAGSTPALFEFDTGGAGLYAASSPNPGASPWWGAATAISPPTRFQTPQGS